MSAALTSRAWVCAGLLLGLAAGPAAAQATLWLKPPAAAQPVWRGMLPTEGGAVGMGTPIGLYPAIGPLGLLAAIFTHAAISQGVQSSQRQREQEEADKVLETYRPALTAWPNSELWAAAVASPPALANQAGMEKNPLKLWDNSVAANEPVVEALPVFTLAQDEGVLIIDVAVKLVSAPGVPAKEGIVRVVSSPHDASDARAFWSADEAKRLKMVAASMLAHAIQLAWEHGPAPAVQPGPTAPSTTAATTPGDEPPMRTHRYLQGSIERSERARRVAGDCARAVLRTLRGGLLSVPLRPPDDASCTRVAAF